MKDSFLLSSSMMSGCCKTFVYKYTIVISRNQERALKRATESAFLISYLFCFSFGRPLFITGIISSVQNALQELPGVHLRILLVPPTCHLRVIISLVKSICSHLLYGHNVENSPLTIKVSF